MFERRLSDIFRFSHMEQPVSLKLKYTVDDPIRVARFVQRQSFIFRHDAILVAGIVFLAFALIIILMADNLAEINILGLVAFSAVPAIILGLSVYLLHRFFNPWLAKRRVTKYFESSPIMNDEKQIKFSNEGIRLTGNLSSSFVKWEAITKAIESETDLMFYTANERFGWYVPKAAFSSAEDLNLVKATLRHSLSDRAELLS